MSVRALVESGLPEKKSEKEEGTPCGNPSSIFNQSSQEASYLNISKNEHIRPPFYPPKKPPFLPPILGPFYSPTPPGLP